MGLCESDIIYMNLIKLMLRSCERIIKGTNVLVHAEHRVIRTRGCWIHIHHSTEQRV
jgi:hypothetical protein